MKLKRLSHLCLSTSDLVKAREFYCDLLGCRVIHEFRNDHGDLYGFFVLVANGTFLEFFRVEEFPEDEKSRFRHFCFEVDDIYAFADHLRLNSFDVEVKRGRTDKVLYFFIHDFDGNRLEFHQIDDQAVQFPYRAE